MSKQTHQYGDAPVQEEYREKLVAIAKTLDHFLNEGATGKDRQLGFVLLLFEFGDNPSRANYISNGIDRRDLVVLLKEQIARFEGQPDMEGHA